VTKKPIKKIRSSRLLGAVRRDHPDLMVGLIIAFPALVTSGLDKEVLMMATRR